MNTQPVTPDWIAVDWRPGARRAWAMTQSGAVLAEAHAPDPLAVTSDLVGAVRALVAPWLTPDVRQPLILVAGAHEAALRPVPCTPLPEEPLRPGMGGLTLVPGLSQANPPGLTEGAETAIAGFLHRQPQFDGVVCLPGRTSHWLRLSAGEVVGFASYLTGAVEQAMQAGPELEPVLVGESDDDTASFDEGVAAAMAAPARVLARLAELRARARLDGLKGQAARARLQGLLIGQEIAGARPYWLGMQVAVVGAGAMADRYGRALQAQGAEMHRFASDDGARPIILEGLCRARENLRA